MPMPTVDGEEVEVMAKAAGFFHENMKSGGDGADVEEAHDDGGDPG